ncbi:hypothetical protein MOUN0_M02630 [Monosporozyma unispora]
MIQVPMGAITSSAIPESSHSFFNQTYRRRMLIATTNAIRTVHSDTTLNLTPTPIFAAASSITTYVPYTTAIATDGATDLAVVLSVTTTGKDGKPTTGLTTSLWKARLPQLFVKTLIFSTSSCFPIPKPSNTAATVTLKTDLPTRRDLRSLYWNSTEFLTAAASVSISAGLSSSTSNESPSLSVISNRRTALHEKSAGKPYIRTFIDSCISTTARLGDSHEKAGRDFVKNQGDSWNTVSTGTVPSESLLGSHHSIKSHIYSSDNKGTLKPTAKLSIVS